MTTVADLMNDALKTYIERNSVYGDSYKKIGNILINLFPDGIKITSSEDFNRFSILITIVSKLLRYSSNFTKGGHQDSIHDLSVYGFMLQELDINTDDECDNENEREIEHEVCKARR